MSKSITCIVLMFGWVFFGCASTNKDQPDSRDVAPDIHGVYFGTQTNDSTEGGWLIFLDSKRNKGMQYVPLSVSGELSDVKIDSLGEVTFTFYDESRFTGKVQGDSLTGILTNSASKSVSNVTFNKIGSGDRNIGQIFSNFYTHEETGDLLGDELVVVHDSSTTHILIAWGEGDVSRPYVGRDVRLAGDTLYFRVSHISYKVVLDSAQVTLFSTGGYMDQTSSVLKKIRTISSSVGIRQ